jgi:uncharacterized protein YlxW (UPF0749 family)
VTGPTGPGAPPGGRRPDASMSLLREVMERPLDPGYAAAAARRGRPVGPVRSAFRSALVLVLAVGIGLGGVWAARDLRTPLPGALSARGLLVEEIRERSAVGTGLTSQNSALRDEVRGLQEQALGAGAQQSFAQAQVYGVWAGTTAVTGPGLVLRLADSDRAAAGAAGSEEERVQDFDLQVVVNGLWASGAEAISVNGVRLTAGTAIRSAGGTVLVDLQPLVSPYRIEAIGDPDGMRVRFASTTAAGHLADLGSLWGITSELSPADDLRLAAGRAPSPPPDEDDG